VYDGANPYADFDGSGTLSERYLYGPAVDMIMVRLSAEGDIAWYLTDHLGSVRDIADTAGTVIDHIQYDSFGDVLSETNPEAGDRFKFTGREFDSATGLYYYRARYYDAAIGRFISEDPLGFRAGDPNLYRYVNNAPGVGLDPTGTQRIPNPGAIYNFVIRRLGDRGRGSTVNKILPNTVRVHILVFGNWQGQFEVNSNVARALGFDIAKWDRAMRDAEKKFSNAGVQVKLTGWTVLAYWAHGNVSDPNSGQRTGRLDYVVKVMQKVVITVRRTGQVIKTETRVIAVLGGSIYTPAVKDVECPCRHLHGGQREIGPRGRGTQAYTDPGADAVHSFATAGVNTPTYSVRGHAVIESRQPVYEEMDAATYSVARSI